MDNTDAAEFSDKYDAFPDDGEGEEPQIPGNMQICQNDSSRPAGSAYQDLSQPQFKTCQNGIARHAGMEHQDVSKRQTRKNENNKNNRSQTENSPSVRPAHTREAGQDGPADETGDALEEIFERCELTLFQPNIRTMFRSVIERLYYSDTLKIGNARLPREKVRSLLNLLDAEVLMNALESMKQNRERVINPTAYLMSVIFNGICEKDSSLILHLPAEYLTAADFYIPGDALEEGGIRDAPE